MMPETFPLMFGEWLPDQPALNNPGATEAKNCIPEARSYRQLLSMSSFSDALAAACVGSFWCQDSGNTIHNFAGSAGALYKLTGGDSWSDITRLSGGSYSAAQWEFEKFGERVIAVNVQDDTQYYDLGVSSNFAALAGSPPKAAHIAVVRDFVVLGNLDVGGTQYPGRLQWGGFNSTELWTPSLATQSDFQDLYGIGGKVQRIVPGEVGIVFQELSVRRMVYEGPPRVFRFDEIERGQGTPASKSVVWSGENVWYLGQDGFQRLNTQGGDPVPIGAEKVDRWFRDNAAQSALDSVVGAVDRTNGLIFWGFKSGSGALTNDRVLIYNYRIDRWSWGELEHEHIGEYIASGYSLDDLTAILPNGIDTDSIPVESTAYKGGGSPGLVLFDSSHQAARLSGTALTATLETEEIGGARHPHLNSCRPLVDGNPSLMTVQVGTRDKQNDTYTYGAAVNENPIGEFDLRNRDRYMRLRLNITGGFYQGQGIEAYGRMGARK